MTRLRGLLLALAVLPGTGLQAQDTGPEALEAAWRAWLGEAGIGTATLAVVQDGEVVRSLGVGTPADAPRPLASLSKPLTAACIGTLVEDGRLAMATRVGEVVDAVGPVAEATVAGLLTHTAGIWPDETQDSVTLQAADRPMTREVARRALSRQPDPARRDVFTYNNENYAILGAMVTALTQKPYQQACRDRVLRPLGVGGSLSGPWVAHGSWGGWSMSAADYARFVEGIFGPGGMVGADPAMWRAANISPDGGAENGAGDGAGDVTYSMGAMSRRIGEATLYWGFGQLCWNGQGDGGYFASYGNGLTVVTLFHGCPAPAAQQALDAALFRAARG